jgi:hypothetical protein
MILLLDESREFKASRNEKKSSLDEQTLSALAPCIN